MTRITVIGGGLAGLVAAVSCAEAGADVRLYEAHATLGGRARTSPPPYIAHEGPHAMYADGVSWSWLTERGLAGPARAMPLSGFAGFTFRSDGRLRRMPPGGVLRTLARPGRQAPVDRDFRSWAAELCGEDAARALANMIGVATFEADPGRLSAAFVWERFVRVFTHVPSPVRYIVGGWGRLVDRLERRARQLGVAIETGARVDGLPPPVIVATSLEAARTMLADDTLRWESGSAALLDLGLAHRRGDPFVVSDLDEAGWLERFTLPDRTLAPHGHSLVQAQVPLRPAESKQAGIERVERLCDLALPGWRDRVTWRREAVARGRSGALDLPGYTWRDRPRIDRGDGVYLAGDMVAAPGLLSEVSFQSALDASAAALRAAAPSRSPASG